jgi:hypothetical protein
MPKLSAGDNIAIMSAAALGTKYEWLGRHIDKALPASKHGQPTLTMLLSSTDR